MSCGGGGSFSGGGYKHYGAFSDTTTQTASLSTVAYPITFNTTEIADGVSMVSGSRITVANTGIYNIQFSLQLDKSSGNPTDIDIWLDYTGSNIARTNTTITINGSQAKQVAAWNFLIPIVATDYVQLMWRADDNKVRILYQTSGSNPSHPATPSAILTVQQV